jgi:hypothetical protein
MNTREKKKETNIQGGTQPPLNQVIRMTNTNFFLQSSKARSIKGFGENISQLSLYQCISSQCPPFQHGLSESGVSSQGVGKTESAHIGTR